MAVWYIGTEDAPYWSFCSGFSTVAQSVENLYGLRGLYGESGSGVGRSPTPVMTWKGGLLDIVWSQGKWMHFGLQLLLPILLMYSRDGVIALLTFPTSIVCPTGKCDDATIQEI